MKKIISLITLCFCFSFFPNVSIASTSGLVVDEFRTRSLDVSTNEYIVLANYSSAPINLNGYALKKITASGRNYELITFSGTSIYPQSKIVLGYTNFSGLKDITYTKNSIADIDTAIAIFDSGSKIIDSVTYGMVNFSGEGSPLPNPAKAIPYKRINGRDTDNNIADFKAVVPETKTDPNQSKIIINEMLPNPETGDEWFEIYNTSSQTVNLLGLIVCDISGSTSCFTLPTEAIAPYAFKAYDKTKTKITLNDDKDGLLLKSKNGTILYRSAIYASAKNGIAFALFPDGWKWTDAPTKAAKNSYKAVIAGSASQNKTAKKKTSSSKSKTSADTETGSEVEAASVIGSEEGEVLGVEKKEENKKINNKGIGYFVIVLAGLIVIGYTINENKERLSDFYHQLTSRNGKPGK